MPTRKLLIASIATLSLSAALPAAARTSVEFYVNAAPPARVIEYVPAPPARVVEYVPAPRPGWAWVPGFWEWRGHHRFWIAGHWVRVRPGYYYAPARWR